MPHPPHKSSDAHVHLQDALFEDDLTGVLAHSAQAGVERFLCNSQTPDDWETLRNLAVEFPGKIIPFFGVHPWGAVSVSDGWKERLESSLRNRPCGIGEIGLDKAAKNRNPIHVQESIFREQLIIAKKYDLTVSVHLFGAMDRGLEIFKSLGPFRGILIHAYNGSHLDHLADWVELGAYFSFSGMLFGDKKEQLGAAAKRIPPDRILLESDAPHLPVQFDKCPANWRYVDSRPRTEPDLIPMILEELALLLKIAPAALAERIESNFERFIL